MEALKSTITSYQTIKPIKKSRQNLNSKKIIEFPNTKKMEFKNVINISEYNDNQHLYYKELIVQELVLNYLKGTQRKPKSTESGYKYKEFGHISKNKKNTPKASGLAMSLNIPIPLLLFKNELHDSFVNGFILKFITGSLFSIGLTVAGFSVPQILSGFIFLLIIAFGDALLAILPNIIKDDSTKMDVFQAKFWLFITNFIAILVGIAGHMYFKTLVTDPNILQNQAINCHIYIISIVGVIYISRIIGNVAAANGVKIKNPFSNFFKKAS